MKDATRTFVSGKEEGLAYGGPKGQNSADQAGSQLQAQVQQRAGVSARHQVLDGRAVTAKGGAAREAPAPCSHK